MKSKPFAAFLACTSPPKFSHYLRYVHTTSCFCISLDFYSISALKITQPKMLTSEVGIRVLLIFSRANQNLNLHSNNKLMSLSSSTCSTLFLKPTHPNILNLLSFFKVYFCWFQWGREWESETETLRMRELEIGCLLHASLLEMELESWARSLI